MIGKRAETKKLKQAVRSITPAFVLKTDSDLSFAEHGERRHDQ
jgi:hypothetical protein